MQCTLHCHHSILTSPLPLCSGTSMLLCIFATHSNATSVAHSIATPMPLSKYTPMPLRSVFGVLICIFAKHSYATPMLLQYHSIRAEWHCRLAYTPIYGNIALHRHYKDTLLPLCQGNCNLAFIQGSLNVRNHIYDISTKVPDSNVICRHLHLVFRSQQSNQPPLSFGFPLFGLFSGHGTWVSGDVRFHRRSVVLCLILNDISQASSWSFSYCDYHAFNTHTKFLSIPHRYVFAMKYKLHFANLN